MKLGMYLGQVNRNTTVNGKNLYTHCALLKRRLQVYVTLWALGCLDDMEDYECTVVLAFTSVSAC